MPSVGTDGSSIVWDVPSLRQLGTIYTDATVLASYGSVLTPTDVRVTREVAEGIS
jgi:hypothetical protein